MAEADIAYVATAGAAGLALAVSAWAVRLRARLQAQAASDARRLETLQAELAGRNGALAAMDEISLSLTPEGDADALAGPPDAAAALTGDAWASPDAVLALLAPTQDERIRALVQSGEPFDALVQAPGDGRPWRVAGRVAGGAAWLRLSPLENALPGLGSGDAAESGLGVLADASPVPTWVTDAAGRLAWANRAWLSEVRAADLAEAQEKA